MTKKEDVPKFIRIVKETWFLVLFVGGIIAAWTGLNMRVNAMEREQFQMQEILAQYPSQQYFDLRFSTIENQIKEIKGDFKQHVNE